MSLPLLERTGFDDEDISEANIQIIEKFTGITFSEDKIQTILKDGKHYGNIVNGLEGVGCVLWFDYRGHLANTISEMNQLIPNLTIQITKDDLLVAESYRPPVKEHSSARDIYNLEYSLGENGPTFHDVVDDDDRSSWLMTFLARIATHTQYGLIPLLIDTESIYVVCTADMFKAYYPEWLALSRKVFDEPLPDKRGDYWSLPLEKPLEYKVFYKPILYSVINDKACILSYSGTTNPPIGERVKPGQSIVDAIGRNLKNTHGYHGAYEVKSFTAYGTALDNSGIRIQRFMSVIKLLEPLDLTNQPFGYRLSWDGTAGNNFESMETLFQST